ncbi:hypothetical protein G6F40_015953 [Rhizopus arrhizus]|nr:hypothetical protein G6F40_015953 [Rhizopus arrhizus]
MEKKFKLTAEEIKPLVIGRGGCIATDRITVEGFPVRIMYREAPDNSVDSGWRFLSGFEDNAYMDDPKNHGAYDVNTIANFDSSIVPLLDAQWVASLRSVQNPSGSSPSMIGLPRKSEVRPRVCDAVC